MNHIGDFNPNGSHGYNVSFLINKKDGELSAFLALVGEHGGQMISMSRANNNLGYDHKVAVGISFHQPLQAAIFLATISADPERAAQFKMFWGGSE